MHITLTQAQYRELLELVHIGSYVRNGVFDAIGEYDPEDDEALEDLLCDIAQTHGMSEVEDYEGFIGLSLEFEEECQALIDQFRDQEFWFELETRLGQRDIDKHMTPEDRAAIVKNNGWLPDHLRTAYDAYAEEFEKYGVDRLEINTKASVLADIHEDGCDCPRL